MVGPASRGLEEVEDEEEEEGGVLLGKKKREAEQEAKRRTKARGLSCHWWLSIISATAIAAAEEEEEEEEEESAYNELSALCSNRRPPLFSRPVHILHAPPPAEPRMGRQDQGRLHRQALVTRLRTLLLFLLLSH